jgi:hypothetical protein
MYFGCHFVVQLSEQARRGAGSQLCQGEAGGCGRSGQLPVQWRGAKQRTGGGRCRQGGDPQLGPQVRFGSRVRIRHVSKLRQSVSRPGRSANCGDGILPWASSEGRQRISNITATKKISSG